MGDGPSDLGSGSFFESQKGISDRRARLGLDQERVGHAGPPDGSGGGGFGFVGALIIGMLWLTWQVLKATFYIFRLLLSRR